VTPQWLPITGRGASAIANLEDLPHCDRVREWVAVAACILAGRRAASINPTMARRYE